MHTEANKMDAAFEDIIFICILLKKTFAFVFNILIMFALKG